MFPLGHQYNNTLCFLCQYLKETFLCLFKK
nr:MAG TPA: hypothetical protein [Caudoviricetes sp.]